MLLPCVLWHSCGNFEACDTTVHRVCTVLAARTYADVLTKSEWLSKEALERMHSIRHL